MKLADAMRSNGLDEHKVALEMIHTIDRLSGTEGEEKLLLEALKEACRVLEPPRAADRSAAGSNSNDAPVNIVLVHHVDRPARPPAQEAVHDLELPAPASA